MSCSQGSKIISHSIRVSSRDSFHDREIQPPALKPEGASSNSLTSKLGQATAREVKLLVLSHQPVSHRSTLGQ